VKPEAHSTPAKDSDGLLLIPPEDFVIKIADEAVSEKLKQVEMLFKSYSRAAKGDSLEPTLRDEALNRAKHWRTVASLLAERSERLKGGLGSKTGKVEAGLM
jgi:hypothetical protein